MESIDYILKMFNLLNLLKYTKNNFLKSSRVERIGYLYILYMISKSIEAITTMKKKDIKSNIFFYIKGLSFIKDKINQEKSKFRLQIKNELNEPIIENSLHIFDKIPEKREGEDIIRLIKDYSKLGKFNSEEGKVSGTVYSNDKKLNHLMTSLFPIYYRSNPLHPDIFPGVRKMEAEIVQMTAHLFHSKNPCAGSFTSGGTESIILACKSYRDLARKNGNYNPSILVSTSGHAAYWKACEYLGIEIIEVPYDNEIDYDILKDNKNINLDYGKLKLDIVKKYIKRNTVAIITSAPTFHFGIIDEIEEIGDYCKHYGINLHVDMCLGGFILPFIEKYKKISFLNKGITSISVDTHKYGCGPKGGSVILYRDEEIFKNQMFVKEDWTGGIYGTSNISGSRCGNIISLTWATMLSIGSEGYRENAEKIITMTKNLKTKLENTLGIFVYGNPEVCIVAVGSEEFDIYLLSDELKEKGWNLNVLQNPSSFHFCITNCHTEKIINEFVEDIKSSIQNVREKLNNCEENTKIVSKSLYGSTQKINDSEIISDVVRDYFCLLNDIK